MSRNRLNINHRTANVSILLDIICWDIFLLVRFIRKYLI